MGVIFYKSYLYLPKFPPVFLYLTLEINGFYIQYIPRNRYMVLSILAGIAWPTMGQSYGCPFAGDVALENVDMWACFLWQCLRNYISISAFVDVIHIDQFCGFAFNWRNCLYLKTVGVACTLYHVYMYVALVVTLLSSLSPWWCSVSPRSSALITPHSPGNTKKRPLSPFPLPMSYPLIGDRPSRY